MIQRHEVEKVEKNINYLAAIRDNNLPKTKNTLSDTTMYIHLTFSDTARKLCPMLADDILIHETCI